jgi:methionyl-tRNA synthetase
LIDNFKIRDACRRLMDLARDANKYFNDSSPWKTIKMDRVGCETSLNISAQVVRALSIAMYPFLPFSSERIWSMLNLQGSVKDQRWLDISAHRIEAGHKLGSVQIVFNKIEDDKIAKQTARLEAAVNKSDVIGTQAGSKPPITINDFSRVDMRAGRITRAEKVDGSKKLLKLQVDMGYEQRQIVSGIAKHFTPEELEGKSVVIAANLQPAIIRGIESQGMLLMVGDDLNLRLLVPDKDVPLGSKVS